MIYKFDKAFVYFFNDDEPYKMPNASAVIQRRVRRIPKIMAAYDRLLQHKVAVSRFNWAKSLWQEQKGVLLQHMDWIKTTLKPDMKGRRVRFGFDKSYWVWYFEDVNDALLFKLQMEK